MSREPAVQHSKTRRPGIIDSSIEGWKIQDDVSNLIGWWKADSLDLVDGDAVVYWEDESGNDNHAFQRVVVNRPTYKEGIANGLPVVRSAGAHFLNFAGVIENLATWFVVWSRTNTANNDYVLGYAAGNYSFRQDANNWYTAVGTLLVVPMAASTFFLKCAVYDGVNHKRYTNGGAEANQVSALDAYLVAIGPITGSLNGDIAEVVIFDTNLVNADRQIVENYLNLKYGLW